MTEAIRNATAEELDEILHAVRARHRELHPTWDLVMVSIEKHEDKNQQIDRIIEFLESMKEP